MNQLFYLIGYFKEEMGQLKSIPNMAMINNNTNMRLKKKEDG